MTPPLSDETLREYADGLVVYEQIRQMARELLTLRARVARYESVYCQENACQSARYLERIADLQARVADTPETVERVARMIATEVARIFNRGNDDLAPYVSMIPAARAALAALAGRGKGTK